MSSPSDHADANLLFGVLCLQADLIDEARFAEACSLWARRKTTPLADLLVERGWISGDDRSHIDFLLARKLRKHDGDAHRSLADIADAGVRDLMRGLDDADVRRTVDHLPPAANYVLLSTTLVPLEQRLRYTLTRLYGEGGLGRVFLAHDNDLNRDVALKELRPDKASHPQAWQRFIREAQLTGQLEHPNIIPVYEVARRPEDDAPFYTMRLVRGQTLREAIADHRRRLREGRADPLEWPRLLNAFVSVCQAVSYAHSRGVVHRDLKPENVMLGGFGEVIVLDWGLAKVVGQPDDPADRAGSAVTDSSQVEATLAGQMLGTPAYAAPEQAEGRVDRIDTRTDVYGLGAILFEILTGRAPHAGDDTAALLRRIASGETPRARSVDPAVPAALDAICARAMARARGDRYARAADLAQEVQRYLADEPVQAYREPLRKRARRWTRRHQSLVSAAAALLIAGVAFLSVLLVLIEGARERAEAQRQRADRHFRRARQAVDDFFTAVSQNRLLGEPGMEPLRKELLEKAQKYYEEFAQEAAGDARVRGDLASTYYRVAHITDLIGSPPVAWDKYRQAAELFEEVLAEDPDNPDWRHGRGQCSNSWGLSHLKNGRMDEALRHLDGSQATLQRLSADRPGETRFRGTLARATFNKALWNARVGLVEEAARLYDQARKIQEKLVADNPRAAEHETDLALTLLNIGNLHLEDGRTEQALPLFEKTLAIESRLVRSDPRSLYHLRTLGSVHHDLGWVHRLMCRMDASLREYDLARKIRARLVKEHPDVTDYRHDLGETLNNIGEIQLFLRHEKEAQETWKQCETLFDKLARDNSTSTRSRSHLGLAHNNLGVVQHQLGKAAESLAHEDRAIELRGKLVRDNPRVVSYRCALADSTNNRGNALRLLERPGEALAAYRKATAMYDPLIRAQPTTTRYRTHQGITLGNIGYLEEEAERVEEALAAYEQSRAVRASLVAQNPKVPRFQADLALAHFCVAKVQTKISADRHAGPIGASFTCGPSPLLYLPFLFCTPNETDSHFSPEAQANYQKALKTQLELVAAFPGIPDYRADLGRTYVQLGNLERDRKEFGKALPLYRQALDVLKPLVADRPRVAEYRKNLAIAYYNFGLTLQDLQIALLALINHEEGRKLREGLVAEKPDDKEYRRDLASTYNSLGLACLALRRYEPALVWFEKAEAVWNRVVAREPDRGRHRTNRARAVLNRGITFAEMERYGQALTEYRRAIALHEEAVDRSPGHFKWREQLGKTHQKMAEVYRKQGRIHDAVAATRQWRRIWTVQSAPLVDVACELALCIPPAGKDGDRLADEVMALLREARARGFRDGARLEREPALGPLRQRQDFRRLLAPLSLTPPGTAPSFRTGPPGSR